MTVEKYFDASKQFDTTASSIFIANTPEKLASDWAFSQPEIGIFGRDFVLWLASCKVVGGIGPRVSITWLWMRVIGLDLVPVDTDHAFQAQNPRQIGTRLGYLTAKSEALFARILRYVAAQEGADSSLTKQYSFQDSEKKFWCF